jgi:hypothetical protein
MADSGLDKLLAELEATFEASVAREEEVAATDLGFALAQTNRLCDVLPRLQQGVVLVAEGVTLAVVQVGTDYVVTDPPVRLVPLGRTLLRAAESVPPPAGSDSSFLLVLRRIARQRALVEIDLSNGHRRSGLLLSAGEDFLTLREPSGQVFLALPLVAAIRPLCDPRSLGL